jgi:arylsulfatase A-like enzyme
MLRSAFKAALLAAPLLAAATAHAETQKPRNVIVFVADGLRYGIVNKDTAPTLYDIQQNGVDFRNSHSVYPTVTTVNASVIATGHAPGDTGEYANNMYWGLDALKSSGATVGDMEDDVVLNEVNARLGGNYLNEDSLLKVARDHGYQTAAIGKEGPVLIQDIGAADGKSTLIFDDVTSAGKHSEGVPLPADVIDAMKAAGIDTRAPDRGLNGSPGAYNMPGVLVPNSYQQRWFVDVATKVVLPRFAKSGQPFALVYWSRDPDGTQHNNGDSLNALSPGINGPTSLAAVRNASDNLQALIDALKAQGLYDNTDIFVTADHGFSTITRQSKTSYAATLSFPDDTVKGFLPQGFVAIDLAHALKLPLNDVYGQPLDKRFHPGGVSLIGADPKNPDVVVVVGGGSDILYLNPAKARDLAPKIVAALSREDYTGALFADESLGAIKGALPFKDARLSGAGKTPKPAIYISFADYALPSCVKKWQNPELCSVLAVDGALQQGQGSHGALSRANTRNFMAAVGPDFKAGFADASPVSNADITPTLAHILGFDLNPKGALVGRVLREALPGGPETTPSGSAVVRSEPAANGFTTVLETQSADGETYLDAAGQPGRVVGLKTKK